jgi:Fe/S biogenesis protein NfuA
MVSWPKWLRGSAKEDGEDGEQPELLFSPVAREKLLEILAPDGPNGGSALRVSVKNPGLGAPQYDMALDADPPRSGDTLIDAGGFRVLVDAASLPILNGATIDFENDPLRPGFRVEPPRPHVHVTHGAGPSGPLAEQVQAVIDQHINPGIAAHGGHVHLLDIRDDVAYVALGGGCQGCAMASVTLKQGVEQMIRQAVPQIKAVVDTTDHAGGTNPYYTAAKDGAASPFHQPAKG